MSSQITAELDDLRDQIRLLRQTEGFARLNQFQQRFIINSLYLEIRKRRFHTSGSKYQKTLEIHRRWYCHASVYALEEGLDLGYAIPSESIPKEFFNDDLYRISSARGLKTLLLSSTFPSIAHVNNNDKNGGRNSHFHSFLTLGTNSNRDVLIWDKQGYAFPFRLITHKQMYSEYSNAFYSVRPIKHSIDTMEIDETPNLVTRVFALIGIEL